MRRNLMFATLLGLVAAASVPSAQATTNDHVDSGGCTAGNFAGSTTCGLLQLCISDLTTSGSATATFVPTNEGTGQFEIEGMGGYYLSKVLNAAPPTNLNQYTGNPTDQPDPGSNANITLNPPPVLNNPTTTAPVPSLTTFPCIGDSNANNAASYPGIQYDDTGIYAPAGTYTIYPGKYLSANCLSTVNGHVVEQPGGGLSYVPGERCHAKVHHFHVTHGNATAVDPNSDAATGGIGMSVTETPYITVNVTAGETTKVQAHMVDSAYPECQESTSTTSPQRVCEPTPGPTGPTA
jgi:hypothetical protein